MTNEITKHVCELCGRTGANGAKYLVKTKDGKTVRVHRPCGEKLVAAAPAEQNAKLVPGPELRAEREAERTARQAQAFWAAKCPQLAGIKNDLAAKEAAMKKEE